MRGVEEKVELDIGVIDPHLHGSVGHDGTADHELWQASPLPHRNQFPR